MDIAKLGLLNKSLDILGGSISVQQQLLNAFETKVLSTSGERVVAIKEFITYYREEIGKSRALIEKIVNAVLGEVEELPIPIPAPVPQAPTPIEMPKIEIPIPVMEAPKVEVPKADTIFEEELPIAIPYGTPIGMTVGTDPEPIHAHVHIPAPTEEVK